MCGFKKDIFKNNKNNKKKKKRKKRKEKKGEKKRIKRKNKKEEKKRKKKRGEKQKKKKERKRKIRWSNGNITFSSSTFQDIKLLFVFTSFHTVKKQKQLNNKGEGRERE